VLTGPTAVQVLMIRSPEVRTELIKRIVVAHGIHICAAVTGTKTVYSTIAVAVNYAYYALLVDATCVPTCGYVMKCIERSAAAEAAIELSGLK
jgi:hypothetical protein